MGKKFLLCVFVVLLALNLTGCFKTHTYQAERPDQSLTGNRGVLVGQPPADTRTATPTRTMIETDIELQTTSEMVKNLKSKKAKSSSAESYADEDLIYSKNEADSVKNMPLDSFETYTIKKNDTLQKISLHFYGTTKNWMKIYKANKDKLKSPDKLIPGKVIRIPKLEKVKAGANTSKSDEGIK